VKTFVVEGRIILAGMPDSRATQDAVAEQSAIRHEQHRHPGKLEGKLMLEGVVPPFPMAWTPPH
jgi:hypothetical protein